MKEDRVHGSESTSARNPPAAAAPPRLSLAVGRAHFGQTVPAKRNVQKIKRGLTRRVRDARRARPCPLRKAWHAASSPAAGLNTAAPSCVKLLQKRRPVPFRPANFFEGKASKYRRGILQGTLRNDR